jgi:hypothetical protein
MGLIPPTSRRLFLRGLRELMGTMSNGSSSFTWICYAMDYLLICLTQNMRATMALKWIPASFSTHLRVGNWGRASEKKQRESPNEACRNFRRGDKLD